MNNKQILLMLLATASVGQLNAMFRGPVAEAPAPKAAAKGKGSMFGWMGGKKTNAREVADAVKAEAAAEGAARKPQSTFQTSAQMSSRIKATREQQATLENKTSAPDEIVTLEGQEAPQPLFTLDAQGDINHTVNQNSNFKSYITHRDINNPIKISAAIDIKPQESAPLTLSDRLGYNSRAGEPKNYLNAQDGIQAGWNFSTAAQSARDGLMYVVNAPGRAVNYMSGKRIDSAFITGKGDNGGSLRSGAIATGNAIGRGVNYVASSAYHAPGYATGGRLRMTSRVENLPNSAYGRKAAVVQAFKDFRVPKNEVKYFESTVKNLVESNSTPELVYTTVGRAVEAKQQSLFPEELS